MNDLHSALTTTLSCCSICPLLDVHSMCLLQKPALLQSGSSAHLCAAPTLHSKCEVQPWKAAATMHSNGMQAPCLHCSASCPNICVNRNCIFFISAPQLSQQYIWRASQVIIKIYAAGITTGRHIQTSCSSRKQQHARTMLDCSAGQVQSVGMQCWSGALRAELCLLATTTCNAA